MEDNEILNYIEKILNQDNFNSNEKKGYLTMYLDAKYRKFVIQYITNGVSRGAASILYNLIKDKDDLFRKRIKFPTFDRWFKSIKKENINNL